MEEKDRHLRIVPEPENSEDNNIVGMVAKRPVKLIFPGFTTVILKFEDFRSLILRANIRRQNTFDPESEDPIDSD